MASSSDAPPPSSDAARILDERAMEMEQKLIEIYKDVVPKDKDDDDSSMLETEEKKVGS